jgi:hypothetical protein
MYVALCVRSSTAGKESKARHVFIYALQLYPPDFFYPSPQQDTRLTLLATCWDPTVWYITSCVPRRASCDLWRCLISTCPSASSVFQYLDLPMAAAWATYKAPVSSCYMRPKSMVAAFGLALSKFRGAICALAVPVHIVWLVIGWSMYGRYSDILESSC